MAVKAFRIQFLKEFLELSQEVANSPKFVAMHKDESATAFFYLRYKRIEYQAKKEEIEQLVRNGFVKGEEVEVIDYW